VVTELSHIIGHRLIGGHHGHAGAVGFDAGHQATINDTSSALSPGSVIDPGALACRLRIEAAYYCDPPPRPPLASRVRPRGSGQAAGGNVVRVALCTKECAQRHSHTLGTAPARSRLVVCEAWVTNGAPDGLGEGTP